MCSNPLLELQGWLSCRIPNNVAWNSDYWLCWNTAVCFEEWVRGEGRLGQLLGKRRKREKRVSTLTNALPPSTFGPDCQWSRKTDSCSCQETPARIVGYNHMWQPMRDPVTCMAPAPGRGIITGDCHNSAPSHGEALWPELCCCQPSKLHMFSTHSFWVGGCRQRGELQRSSSRDGWIIKSFLPVWCIDPKRVWRRGMKSNFFYHKGLFLVSSFSWSVKWDGTDNKVGNE